MFSCSLIPTNRLVHSILYGLLFVMLSDSQIIHAAHIQESQKEVVIPAGTQFTVVMIEGISSNTHFEGEALALEVAEDVLINGRVVIAKGAPVKAVVAKSRKAKGFGINGRLAIKIESTTTVDGQEIKLRGSQVKKGANTTGVAAGLVIAIGALGFLVEGRNAKIKAGTKIKVYTDEEKTIRFSSSGA